MFFQIKNQSKQHCISGLGTVKAPKVPQDPTSVFPLGTWVLKPKQNPPKRFTRHLNRPFHVFVSHANPSRAALDGFVLSSWKQSADSHCALNVIKCRRSIIVTDRRMRIRREKKKSTLKQKLQGPECSKAWPWTAPAEEDITEVFIHELQDMKGAWRWLSTEDVSAE